MYIHIHTYMCIYLYIYTVFSTLSSSINREPLVNNEYFMERQSSNFEHFSAAAWAGWKMLHPSISLYAARELVLVEVPGTYFEGFPRKDAKKWVQVQDVVPDDRFLHHFQVGSMFLSIFGGCYDPNTK